MSTKSTKGLKDPIFSGGMLEAIQTFDRRGIYYPTTLLCEKFLNACDHVSHLIKLLTPHHGPFWEKFDAEEIDISDIDTSLYDLVLRKLGVPFPQLLPETCDKRNCLLLLQLNSDMTITSLMNHFLRYIIKQLQLKP